MGFSPFPAAAVSAPLMPEWEKSGFAGISSLDIETMDDKIQHMRCAGRAAPSNPQRRTPEMNVHRSNSVQDESITAAAAKAAFPVGVSGSLLFGMPISDLVQIATLLFLVLQIGLLVPKYWTLLKNRWGRGK